MGQSDIQLKDMLFIAENKETGVRIEFSIFELQHYDDFEGGMDLNSSCYSEKLPENGPCILTGWSGDKYLNDEYIFRLRREDEDEEGLIKPRRMVSVKPLAGYRLSIIFSDGAGEEFDLYGRLSEQDKENFNSYKVTERYIEWKSGTKVGIVELRNYWLVKNKNINDVIRTERLELYPRCYEGLNQLLHDEMRAAGEVELFCGVEENDELQREITIDRSLFYHISHASSRKIEDWLVGYVGLNKVDSTYEVEVYIVSKYRRNGFAVEAVTTLLEKAFAGELIEYSYDKGREVVSVDEVRASVRIDNMASKKLMERCGFQKEGEAWILNKENFKEALNSVVYGKVANLLLS